MGEQADLATRVAIRSAGMFERAWDEGNAMGLDGWVGPLRGTEPDDHAINRRERMTDRLVDELMALIRHHQSGNPESGVDHE